jgi:hypothetical protein
MSGIACHSFTSALADDWWEVRHDRTVGPGCVVARSQNWDDDVDVHVATPVAASVRTT